MDKEAIKKIMVDYLTINFNYPHMDAEIVIENLPNLWRELDKHALIPNGMKYEQFKSYADSHYMNYWIRKQMGS